MPEPAELSLFVERLEAVGAPYMVTGATAAILYGQPRVTNDLDVVLSLNDSARTAQDDIFWRRHGDFEFLAPMQTPPLRQRPRVQRIGAGKVDVGFVSRFQVDEIKVPALRTSLLRLNHGFGRHIKFRIGKGAQQRKLEYYREGLSTKHTTDIQAIRKVTGVDEAILAPWLERMGLTALWQELKRAG